MALQGLNELSSGSLGDRFERASQHRSYPVNWSKSAASSEVPGYAGRMPVNPGAHAGFGVVPAGVDTCTGPG